MSKDWLERMNKKEFQRTDRAWVYRDLIFSEDFPLQIEDVLSGGPTMENPAVEKAVVERANKLTTLDARNRLNLAEKLWMRLSPSVQKFFNEHIHRGKTFSAWFTGIPLKGTRLSGGRECVVTITDLKNVPLLESSEQLYQPNSLVTRILSPVVGLTLDRIDMDNDCALLRFELLHEDSKEN